MNTLDVLGSCIYQMCDHALDCFRLCVLLMDFVFNIAENKPIKVLIEFSLEKPQGGVQFVLPPDGCSPEAMVW